MPLLFTRESKGEKFVARVPEFFGNELYSDFVGRVHGGGAEKCFALSCGRDSFVRTFKTSTSLNPIPKESESLTAAGETDLSVCRREKKVNIADGSSSPACGIKIPYTNRQLKRRN